MCFPVCKLLIQGDYDAIIGVIITKIGGLLRRKRTKTGWKVSMETKPKKLLDQVGDKIRLKNYSYEEELFV